MATTDLVADYGAVGDGQYESVTGSITSGASPVLTPATPIFGAGDVGKAIVVYASGFSYPTSGAVITIASYNAGTGAVTLTGTNSTAKTSVAMEIIWGTDNTTAFMAYRTWAQGLGSAQAHLTIPAGHYCANIGPFAPLNLGVQNALITGPSGAPETCTISKCYPAEMRLGGDVAIAQNRGLTHASATMARLNSTTAGSSTATLVDSAGYGSRITVGARCIVHGYDTQSVASGSFGYPPNPYFYEYNTITGYDTGTITFQSPLQYAYMSDWPVWSTSSTVTDQGGAATIYVLTDWDRVVEIQDVTLLSPVEQIACHGRSVILRNVIMPGYGVYPTMCETYEAYDCTYVVQLEVDKIVGSATFDNCTGGILKVQSASPDVLTVTGGSWRQISGSPKRLVVDGTDMTGGGGSDKQILLGPGFGRTNSVVLRNITNLDRLISGPSVNSGIHGGGIAATMPMVDGVFSFARSENDGVGGYQNPGAQLMPGTWVMLDNRYFLKIIRVWDDGTRVYHQTNLSGDWPYTASQLTSHPCPDLTIRNCSGAAKEVEDGNNAPDHTPMYAYSKRTYVGGPTGASASGVVAPTLRGRFVSETIDVTVPYVGAGTLNFLDSQFLNRNYYNPSDWNAAAVSDFGSSVNAKISGARVIRAATTATGAQASDSLEDLTAEGQIVFFGVGNSVPVWSANVTNGETPTVTVEYIMDQGLTPVAVVPLRFRLRAA